MELLVTKMSGTGNDFFIIDLTAKNSKPLLQQSFPGLNHSDIAKVLCRGTEHNGADGLVLLLDKPDNTPVDFQWDFYNADGSQAEMCGNAARCVAKFAFTKGLCSEDLSFKTIAGTIFARVFANGLVEVGMPPLDDIKLDQKLRYDNQDVEYTFINSGVPHAVVKSDGISNLNSIKELAAGIRNHSKFQPAGTNASFYKSLDNDKIQAVSFERGVEDFTKACGTGAVACAKTFLLENPSAVKKVHVQVPGGNLDVDFSGERPLLIGPAEFLLEFPLTNKD